MVNVEELETEEMMKQGGEGGERKVGTNHGNLALQAGYLAIGVCILLFLCSYGHSVRRRLPTVKMMFTIHP
jgi:hypothetical protein